MKTSKPTDTMNHPDELLLPFAENSLAPSDTRSVERHLSECPQCSAAVEKLAEAIHVLKSHENAFCPEPWELYDFVFHGEDPEESIERHVQRCESCRARSEMWASQMKSESIPDHLLAQINDSSSEEELGKDQTYSPRFTFKKRFFKRLVVPSLSIGAAAAAVLVVFLLMPQEIPQSIIAPSAVTWENAPKPKAFQASRYRTAIVIALKGFPTPWPQSRVDSLYRALTPTLELSRRFDILQPEVVSEAIQSGKGALRTEQDMTALLRKKLGVKRVAVIVVSPVQDQLEIQGEWIDTEGGVTLKQTRTKLATLKDLDSRIKQMVTELMSSEGR